MAHDVDPFAWAAGAFRDKTLAARYVKYRRYSQGDQDLAFATPMYTAIFGSLFKAFSYSRMGGVVDAHADRLQIERFVMGSANDNSEESDESKQVRESINALAAEIWQRNRMDERAGEVHKEALLTGDGHVIVWPETGDTLGEDGVFPQLWPQKADHVRVHYDDEQPGLVTLAAKTWQLHDGRRRLNLYYPDRIEKYVTRTKNQELPKSAAQLDQFQPDGEPWPVPNPWGVVPVIHFANNAGTGEYGASELRDVIPLQDALNKVLTDLILASEMGGFPQKVILGLDSGDPQVQEGLRRLQAGLNKIFTIPVDPGGATPSIDEFTATNLTQITQVVELFDKLISRVSRVPVHYLQMSGDFPSGRALRTAEAPFVSKIEDRQTSYGNAWEDVMSLALRMAGVADPGDVSAIWKSAAPLSEEDKWDLAKVKAEIGLPLEQILREAGYDEDTIAQVMAEEQARRADVEAQLERRFSAGMSRPADADDEEDAA